MAEVNFGRDAAGSVSVPPLTSDVTKLTPDPRSGGVVQLKPVTGNTGLKTMPDEMTMGMPKMFPTQLNSQKD